MKYFLLLAAFVFLSGCKMVAPFAFMGAGAAGVITLDHRSVGMQIDDKVILMKAYSILKKYNKKAHNDIDIAIVEGRVLLIGNIKKQLIADELIEKIWNIKGVKEVISELRITSQDKKTHKAIDNFLMHQIRLRLIVE